jgi:ParB-like chromosome segregation protein Spo0J
LIQPSVGARVQPISEISIGHRHRQEDIDALAASIEAIGLLHPVVVSQHGRLLAGQRRLMAFEFP